MLACEKITTLLSIGSAWHMIDEIVTVNCGESILARKVFNADDPILRAHFTNGNSLVPGVLLLEAAAQAAALLETYSADNGSTGEKLRLIGDVQARFSASVFPGQAVDVNVTIVERIGGVTRYRGIMSVLGKRVCSIWLMGSSLN